ncbi:MAG: M6 family metalloprotease domain-containing protein [Bacteroidetes bacterium]|nr:M6 family metalloprotease domain-containing protein [Bacteroidota bacterium]
MSNRAIAVSAYPYPVEFTQPDGSKIMIKMKGDERVRWAETLDGYSVIFNKTGTYEYAVLDIDNNMIPSGKQAKNEANRSLKEKNYLSSIPKGIHYSATQVQQFKMAWNVYLTEATNVFPTTGNRNLVCILIGFTDVPFTKTNADFNNLFNQINYTVDGATGSVKDFYLENSYNKLNLTITVAGPYTAAHNMAYYGADNGSNHSIRAGELITEAVNAANPTVNFANFDNDNNGSVDGVYVIFAGYGQEAGASTDAIWSHASSIPTLTLDGKTVSKYSCSPEFRGNTGGYITRIGVICHEFGHVLGAPDYYDTDYATNGQYDGTGDWDLMAGGSWNNGGRTPAHHNAYTKTMVYHWATATVLSSAALKTLHNSIDDTASFYRYNTATSNEYFLMENRQQQKFDALIPGHGLLIYHVDGNAMTGAINAGSHQGMYPVCANAGGNAPTTYGTINGTGCTFPGSGSKTSFTDVTTPNSKSWANANTNKPITNITEDNTNKTISFAFMGGYTCTMTTVQASNLSFSNLTTTSMTVSCTRGNGNKLLILAREGTDVFVTLPVGSTYIANSVFGSGQQIGTGNYVIYNGTGNSVNITGLTQGTTYYFACYEYNTAENCYLIPALAGNKTTNYIAPLAAGAISGDTNVCVGENNVTFIVPTITYATNYTWTYPNGANGYSNTNGININFGNNAVSGYITVTGSNPAGSSNTASIYVNVNPIPPTPVVTQNGNMLISSSTIGNEWFDQSTGPISTDANFIPNQSGNYYVVVNVNGCESAPSNIITVNITGIKENSENPFAVHIYPNPSSGNTTLTYTLDKSEIVSFSLTDITGHEIYKTNSQNQNKGEHQFNINAAQLSAGLYIYKLQIGSSLQKGKFIVK